MKHDKKVVAGEMLFALPERIGGAVIRRGIALTDIERALAK
jgi:3-dehydroquinate synthetase